MAKLTLKQRATNHETWRHINRVQQLMTICIKKLLDRAVSHDQSKLETPEVEMFAEHTDVLAGLTYGSDEYEACLEAIAPALVHHYANNRHHPQHYKDGVNDMNLLDLLEMFCDWKAASERHDDGNIRQSIEHNASKYNMTKQLCKIFENTVETLA